MKNRQFISIILCICLFGGLGLFFSIQNPTEDIVATDNLSEKEKIDNYFKDKEPLYETMLKDMGYNVSVFIDSTYIDGNGKYYGLDDSHDKKIEINCNDCKCGKLYENTVPLMVMLISEQVESLIGRPGYIQVEVNDSYWCEDEIKTPVKGRGCGGTKRHAECY